MRGNKKIPFLLCLVVKKVQAMLRNKHDDFVAFILRVGLIFLAFFFFFFFFGGNDFLGLSMFVS